jgi:hypothetical protein
MISTVKSEPAHDNEPARNEPDLGLIRGSTPPSIPRPGLTLSEYAQSQKLPLSYLKSAGLTDQVYEGYQAVRIPYQGVDGQETATRYQVGLGQGSNGADFKWKKGSKPGLYGLWRLKQESLQSVVLVDRESDCHMLWSMDIAALGLPGAGNWKEERDASNLDGIPAIFIAVSGDEGNETIPDWLRTSSIRERVFLIHLGKHKDLRGLYVDTPDLAQDRWQQAVADAVPWSTIADRERAQQKPNRRYGPGFSQEAFNSSVCPGFAVAC